MRTNLRIRLTPTDAIPARWQTAVLLLVAFVVRGGLLVLFHENLQSDPDGYRRIAENLVAHGTLGDDVPVVRQLPDGALNVTRTLLPTAYRPPLYLCILAIAIASPFGIVWFVAAFHLILGLLTVWLTVGVGVRLHLGKAAVLAGALVALDPLLLHQSTLVMTETLATFLAVCSVGCLIRCAEADFEDKTSQLWRQFALAGAVLALAILCRPTFLLMLPLAGVWLWFQLPKSSARGWAAVAYGLSAAIVLSPWGIRNARVFGKPTITTTHGGYTLHLANNPGFYQFLRDGEWGSVWKSTDNFRLHPDSDLTLNMTDYPERRLSQHKVATAKDRLAIPDDIQRHELLFDQLHYADALVVIRNEPGMFAWSVLVRLGRLWQPLPHRAALAEASPSNESESLRAWSMRYAVALWYVAVYLLAALGLWNLRGALLRSPWCFPALLVACFMAVHALYWTDMRMRAPLVPLVCWWAAAGWNCYRPLRLGRKA